MEFWGFIIAGIVSGVIAGMGMGGGTLLIPILTIFLSIPQQIAQGINLVAFLPMSIVVLIIHFKNKLVDFGVGLPIVLGGVVSAIIGSLLAIKLSNKTLKILFGIFLLCVGVWQIIYSCILIKNQKKKDKQFCVICVYNKK